MQRRLNRDLRRGTVPSELSWDYSPTERQAAFHRSTARYRLYGGAMGGGKTYALCAEAIALSLRYPGNRGYMCRNQLIDFRRSTLVTFDRVCPPSWLKGHYRDDRVIEFRNGSAIVYGGLGGEEDLERIKSTEFGWFAIDEATETLEDMFLLLCSRLRWKLTSGNIPRYYGILASNPEPGWVKERFVDQTLPDHEFFPALPRDNPFLPPDYDKNLRILYPDEWVKRYLDGSWDVFEGQIYKEFDRNIHVHSNIEISPHWPVYRIIDHGYNNPTCCLWIAIDYDNRAIVFDEHYERFKTIKENSAAIRAKYPDFRGLTLCDPSMFSRTMQREGKAWSPADEYRSYGITCVSPYRDDNWVSEGIGINLVKQRLKDRLITIHKDCRNTIKEIIKYRWRDLSAGDKGEKAAPEVPVDVDNHACFAAGTMIDTPTGPRPIETIRAGDAIITHLGVGRAHSDSVFTGMKKIWSLTVNDIVLYCTGDHKFMTPQGMVPAAQLNGGAVWQKRTPGTKESAITSTHEDTMPRRGLIQRWIRTAARCIPRSGKTPTGKYPTDSISITLTESKPTTASRTSWLSTGSATFPTFIQTISTKRGSWQRSGTHPMPEENGIKNIHGKFGTRCKRKNITASTAEANSNLSSRAMRSFAATPIKPIIDWLLALMISNHRVLFAARLSGRIAIARRGFAPRNVVASGPVKAEKEFREEPVYNLSSSDGTISTSGILSRQCDCLRYFAVWRPASAMPPKAPEDRNSWAYYIKKLKAGRSREYAGWS